MSKEHPIFISYPITGTKTLSAGTFELNFREGETRVPASTSEPMSGSIKADQVLKSFFINCSARLNIAVFNDNARVFNGSIQANGFSIPNIHYDTIHVIVAAGTPTIQVIGTTNENPPHQ